MPERVAQVEDPADLPRPGPGVREIAQLQAQDPQLAQVAGALAALARRVEAVERPVVTRAQRREALEQARDYVAELGTRPGSEAERIASEVAVARYLTGE